MICSVVGSAEHSDPCIETNNCSLCKMPIDDVSSQPEINFLEHHIHIKVVAIHVYSMATFARVYREPCIGKIKGVTCLKTNYEKKQFTVPENIPTPPPWGAGGSVRPKNFKKCMKLRRGAGNAINSRSRLFAHSQSPMPITLYTKKNDVEEKAAEFFFVFFACLFFVF